MSLNYEDLDEDTKEKLGLAKEKYEADLPVNNKVVALGKVIKAISKLTNRDALWVMGEVYKMVTGRPDRRGGYHPRKKE